MSVFDSLPAYQSVPFGRGRKAKIKKLNLGESLEFMVLYDSYLLRPALRKKTARQILKLILLNRAAFFSAKEKSAIIHIAKQYNYPPQAKPEGRVRKPVPDWLQSLFVAMSAIGYSKSETLSLYPAEIEILLRIIDLRNDNHTRRDIMTAFAPKQLMESIMLKQEGRAIQNGDIPPLDRKAVEPFKRAAG